MINWKVRLKNPVWWVQMVLSIVIPLIAGMGMQWSDMTTWPKLGETLISALQNPVIVGAMLVSAWGAITDPTTKGLGDSVTAMGYDAPKE